VNENEGSGDDGGDDGDDGDGDCAHEYVDGVERYDCCCFHLGLIAIVRCCHHRRSYQHDHCVDGCMADC